MLPGSEVSLETRQVCEFLVFFPQQLNMNWRVSKSKKNNALPQPYSQKAME